MQIVRNIFWFKVVGNQVLVYSKQEIYHCYDIQKNLCYQDQTSGL